MHSFSYDALPSVALNVPVRVTVTIADAKGELAKNLAIKWVVEDKSDKTPDQDVTLSSTDATTDDQGKATVEVTVTTTGPHRIRAEVPAAGGGKPEAGQPLQIEAKAK